MFCAAVALPELREHAGERVPRLSRLSCGAT